MTIDEVMPDGSWQFDEEVTDVFDDMLARSIPDYENMRRLVLDVGSQFIGHGSVRILDLGTSRGEALARYVERYGARGRFDGVEISQPMIEAARERFSGMSEYVSIESCDLRYDFPKGQGYNVVLSVLTLMFVPIEYRQSIVQRIYDALAPGGVLILVEKVLGANAQLNEALIELYLDLKRRSGYTQEQIERKRLSLEGVLVPVTADWNIELLKQAGFTPIDCFWRYLNFGGWVAVRPRGA